MRDHAPEEIEAARAAADQEIWHNRAVKLAQVEAEIDRINAILRRARLQRATPRWAKPLAAALIIGAIAYIIAQLPAAFASAQVLALPV